MSGAARERSVGIMDIEELVRKRRSVRRFDPRPVEEDKISRILECARLAPSARNLQCWHYIVVTGKETIAQVAEAAGAMNAWLRDAPAVVVGCADPRESTAHNGIEYFTVDLAISMEHLVLAATELGLGTCWMANFDEARVKEALSIPENIRVVALTPLGHPAGGQGPSSPRRKAASEFVHREAW
jgi:nitroreductase